VGAGAGGRVRIDERAVTFRTRIVLAFAAVAVLPVALFGWRVRAEMQARLEEEGSRRVGALVSTIESELRSERSRVRARLGQLGSDLAVDNRFRLVRQGGGESSWLLDWAGEAMRAAGLAALTLHDSAGRVLSSGQYRNDYGRSAPLLLRALEGRGESLSLARVRTAEGQRSVLAAIDSFALLGQRYYLVGGAPLDSSTIAGFGADPEVRAVLVGKAPLPETVAARIPVIVVDEVAGESAAGVVAIVRDPGPARDLTRRVDRWFVLVLGVTLLGAIGIAVGVANALARPITELADKTGRIDLDRLDVAFETDRTDEIGGLSRLLAAMTTRLKHGAARLRESERRAAVGDLARQVTHDIKNGLAPIRHAVRHFGQTVDQAPDQLVDVYRARRGTMESSVAYLDDLARNYARLSPASGPAMAEANRLVDELARGAARDGVVIRTELMTPEPLLRADPVPVRRILENLLANAVDAASPAGQVVLRVRPGAPGQVVIEVADTGAGMTREQLDRAFDDFFTTKPQGTGLGLSVVRRLVSDLGGSLAVETAVGQGTTFRVELPTA